MDGYIIMNYIIEKTDKFNLLIANEGYMLHLIGDNGYTNEIGIYFPPEYSKKVYLPKEVDISLYEAIKIEEIKESEETENGSN